jgi:hypothetical protein
MCFTPVQKYLCSFTATEPLIAHCKQRTYGWGSGCKNYRLSRLRFAVHDSYIYPESVQGTSSESVQP